MAAGAPDAQEVGIDIRSSQITGRFLLRSGVYDPGDPSSFAINLVPTDDAGDSLSLGRFSDTDFSVPVVSGLYRPAYFHLFGEAAPANRGAILPRLVNARQVAVQDIDVPAVDITADFLHNGAPFPQQADVQADFYLVPEGPGELVFLGASNRPAAAVTVLPGRYAVVYRYQRGSGIPVNRHSVVLKRVRLSAPRHLTVHVRSSVLESRATLNGQAFPASAYDYGQLVLVDPQGQDLVELGETFAPLPARRIIHGSYDVHYRSRESLAVTPRNPDAIVARDVAVSRRSQRLSVDVRAITVAGAYRVNGSAPPASPYDYARIGVRQAGTEAVLTLGDTFEQGFGPLPLVAGTYEAVYTHREGTTLPANVDTVFIDKLTWLTTGTYTLDIPALTVRLAVTLNGSPFPDSAYDYAEISALADPGDGTPGAPIRLGNTLDPSLRATLLPGRYDFVYACRECDSLVPLNRHASFLEGSLLSASTTLTHDFQARPVRVNVTLNGAGFPAGPGAAGEIHVGQTRADKASLGLTSDPLPAAPVLLLRGAYQVHYALRDPGDFTVVPINRDAVVGRFVVD